MKKLFLSLLSVFLVATSLSVGGATKMAPKVGEVYTTADEDVTGVGRHSVRPAMVGNAIINMTPVLGVHPTSPSFNAFMANLFADAEAGNGLESLPFGTLPATPANYSVIDRKVNWHAFAYSMNTPMYAGILNPSSPFQDERGLTVGWLVTVSSADGTDSVSLADLRFDSNSSDIENSLGIGIQMVGYRYSLYARGYKANGTVLQSDPGTELVRQVRLYFYTPLYNGGGTINGLGEIQNFVEGMHSGVMNFKLTGTVTLTNGQSISRTVETNPSTTVPAPLISITGSQLRIIQGNGNLQMSGTINGTWVSIQQVSTGDTFNIPDGGNRFFRVVQ